MSKFEILNDVFRKSDVCDLCFVFFKGSLLLRKFEDNLYVPNFDEIKDLNITYKNKFFIGEFGNKSCFTVEISDEIDLTQDFKFLALREVGALMEEEIFLAAGRASEVLNWDRTHKFCGKCGNKTENKKDEMAKICPKCGNIMYPVICPAIIVGITKGDKILLAHNKNFANNRYSLIAGFVEAGENLEDAVKREVFEEVGIKIKNVRYYKSSAWPFPNSLMLGFFADYESEKIKVDGEEILAAEWFSKDNLPNIPLKFTLARKLIDEFVKQ